MDTSAWITLGTGLGVVFFTGALWVATHRMGTATRELVKSADDTAKRQLRAYVHDVSCETIDTWHDPPESVRITIKNFGQTPAYAVRHVADQFICPSEDGADPIIPWIIHKDDEGAVIGPGAEAHRTLAIEYQDEREKSLLRENFYLSVGGEVRYVDAFNDKWYFKYRYVLRLDPQGRHRWERSDGGQAAGPDTLPH